MQKEPDIKFIADVHLGKLARLLRLAGFDTAYNNSSLLATILDVAREQKRIFLTRNASVRNVDVLSFYISYNQPVRQLKQVISHFNLVNNVSPFSRCIVCNGALEAVPKQNIVSQLQEDAANYFSEFWQCNNCKRIYWKGSHYDSMLTLMEGLKDDDAAAG